MEFDFQNTREPLFLTKSASSICGRNSWNTLLRPCARFVKPIHEKRTCTQSCGVVCAGLELHAELRGALAAQSLLQRRPVIWNVSKWCDLRILDEEVKGLSDCGGLTEGLRSAFHGVGSGTCDYVHYFHRVWGKSSEKARVVAGLLRVQGHAGPPLPSRRRLPQRKHEGGGPRPFAAFRNIF